ncbi:MerR family transcriptional regulator [Actinorhabdospora filicis]|uniref:MerR family transcriptional regulator n=1 Tax=Actinorhabdospora filicis TaxID=1785913 RepID=A0A9W6SKX1_9ACTN|nr:helix-turn-helix domain-containing protein [Actinorhabdospora filicis]GLZ78880.1 MerR family transcriptional regulator [Actinorhabdospora filicis]
MAELYSVEQVADLLGLHVKTVRAYVRDGRLKAARIGKSYRVAREDLDAFTGRPSPEPEPRLIDVSAVVRVDGIDAVEMRRAADMLMAAIAGPPDVDEPLRVETVFDEARRSMKILVLGGPGRAAGVLAIIDTYLKERQ